VSAISGIPAVVLAGGLGTRLRAITNDRVPKPMVPVPLAGAWVPFLEFPLAHLRAQGVVQVVICVGHLGDRIRSHFEDGTRFGLDIAYDDAGPADTGLRVLRAMRRISGPSFLVVCGDTYHPIDVGAFMRNFGQHATWLMQLAVKRDAPGTTPNVAMTRSGHVVAYDELGVAGPFVGVETGTLVLRRQALDGFEDRASFSLTTDVYPHLIANRSLGSLETDAPFFDIGTPEGYDRFCARASEGAAQPISIAQ